MYLLQIVEKLVDIATHTHQAIFEFLEKNGMNTYQACIQIQFLRI
jgi:hypothetical protein